MLFRSSAPATLADIDAWVCAQEASTPFHRPMWIQAVERATGQRAVMLVSRDAAGDIAGVLPLTIMKSMLFGKALVSSGFGIAGGILADSDAVALTLAEAAWALANQLGCTTCELRGGPVPGDEWYSKDDVYLNFARPLVADDEAQLASVPKRHRAEIRKGLANDLTFRTGQIGRAHV